MFVVSQKPTFTAPVVANIPGDGGRVEKAKFSVIFKALSKDEVDEMLGRIRRRAKEVDGNTSDSTPLKDRELLDELLVGFGADVVEEDRTPMKFTPSNVDRLCAIWPIEAAIVKSFFEHYISAPAKN